MIEEHVLDEVAPAASALLPDAAKEASSIVLNEIKSDCMVYDVNFPDLPKAHEHVAGDSLNGKVNLVLNSPPCNVRNDRSMENYLHDIFAPEDLTDFVELLLQVMATGAH